MKLSLQSAVIAVLFSFCLILPTESYSHAKNKFRSKCSTWKSKYKSNARITDFGIPLCVDNDGSCYSSAAYCAKNCGYATTQASQYVNFIDTKTYAAGGLICGAGEGTNHLTHDIWTDEHNKNTFKNTYEAQCKLEYEQNLDLLERTYNLFNASGKLVIDKNYQGIVKLEIILWRANDNYLQQIEDTEITEEKILYREYISIRNNKIQTSDYFAKNKAIHIVETEDQIIIKITDLNLSFEISDDVDMEEELVIEVISHSDPDNEAILGKKLEESNHIDLYPNPSFGEFMIAFPQDYNVDQSVKVNLYDSKGSLIKTVYEGILKHQNISIKSDNLPSGVYFIMIVGQTFSSVKKLHIVTD